MNRLLLFLFLLYSSFNSYSQLCQFVEITTTATLELPECNVADGNIFLSNTQGGTTPYRFDLNGQFNRFGSFNNLEVGNYTLIITDARGCADTSIIDLNYTALQDIIKPDNAFTPNGDDVNDRWFIPSIESFDGSEVRVFNRWGQRVHQNTEYTNELGWDGTQNGSNVPEGTYYYVISIKNNCIEEFLNGTVTVIR